MVISCGIDRKTRTPPIAHILASHFLVIDFTWICVNVYSMLAKSHWVSVIKAEGMEHGWGGDTVMLTFGSRPII